MLTPEYPKAALADLYQFMNEEYFHSKLPRNIKVVWTKMHRDILGKLTYNQKGKPQCIHINKAMRSPIAKGQTCVVKMTLLHEMAHISAQISGNAPDPLSPYLSQDEHGQDEEDHTEVWQSIMRRLANAGAFDRLW